MHFPRPLFSSNKKDLVIEEISVYATWRCERFKKIWQNRMRFKFKIKLRYHLVNPQNTQ